MSTTKRPWHEDTQLLTWEWIDPLSGVLEPSIRVSVHVTPTTDPLHIFWELHRAIKEISHALSPGAIHEHDREANSSQARATEDETCYPATSDD